MSQAVNFARWLERLGFKRDDAPAFLNVVQPVAIVADHRFLVSPALRVSYAVGANFAGTIGQFAAIAVTTPVPLLVQMALGATTGTTYALTTGLGPHPALLNQQPLVPQQFRFGFGAVPEAAWSYGEFVAAPSLLLPAWRVGVNSDLNLSEIYVPPGGFAVWHANTGTPGQLFAARVTELPNENPQ